MTRMRNENYCVYETKDQDASLFFDLKLEEQNKKYVGSKLGAKDDGALIS